MSGRPPLPEGLAIPGDKVVKYLLNTDHPKGGSKARFFRRFGFSVERPLEFAEALFAQAKGALLFERYPTEFGVEMVECVGRITTPSGRRPWIRTVWLVKDADNAALVTAVPDRERTD